MEGAREFARFFKTGQYGRFYIISGSHARGTTFRIYVLPQDMVAIGNGSNNPPLNQDAVQVYGIVSGQPGWTEEYSWLYEGKWQEDFSQLFENQKALENEKVMLRTDNQEKIEAEGWKRTQELLSLY